MMDKCRAAVCTIFSLASALASTPLWVVSSSDFYFLPFRLCFCARRLTSTSHKHVDRWLNRFLFNSTEQVGLTRRLPSPLSVQKACVKWLKYTYVYWSPSYSYYISILWWRAHNDQQLAPSTIAGHWRPSVLPMTSKLADYIVVTQNNVQQGENKNDKKRKKRGTCKKITFQCYTGNNSSPLVFFFYIYSSHKWRFVLFLQLISAL